MKKLSKAERKRIALMSTRKLRKLVAAIPDPTRGSIADYIKQQDALDLRIRGRNRRKDVEYIKAEKEPESKSGVTPIKRPEGWEREYKSAVERQNEAADKERGNS